MTPTNEQTMKNNVLGANRPKNDNEVMSVINEDTTVTIVKRGRGRPRKHPIIDDTNVVKRGRGRPRKHPIVDDTNVVKRGRGRPRKYPMMDNNIDDMVAVDDSNIAVEVNEIAIDVPEVQNELATHNELTATTPSSEYVDIVSATQSVSVAFAVADTASEINAGVECEMESIEVAPLNTETVSVEAVQQETTSVGEQEVDDSDEAIAPYDGSLTKKELSAINSKIARHGLFKKGFVTASKIMEIMDWEYGWVRLLLGEPDKEQMPEGKPHYKNVKPMRLYDVYRVLAALETPEYCALRLTKLREQQTEMVLQPMMNNVTVDNMDETVGMITKLLEEQSDVQEKTISNHLSDASYPDGSAFAVCADEITAWEALVQHLPIRVSVPQTSNDDKASLHVFENEMICFYNQHHNHEFVTARSQPEILNRAKLFYIMNRCVDYNADLIDNLVNRQNGEHLMNMFHNRILKQVAHSYPDLANYCRRQMR